MANYGYIVVAETIAEAVTLRQLYEQHGDDWLSLLNALLDAGIAKRVEWSEHTHLSTCEWYTIWDFWYTVEGEINHWFPDDPV